MKLIERWILEAIATFKGEFTLDEIRGAIVAKKGNSLYIGNDTQLAHYCKRHARRVSDGTYRRI
jgi:hypothetical protein